MESFPRMDALDGDDDTSDEDLGFDDSFDEDMEALKRACMLTGANPDAIQPPSTPSAAACGPNADSGSDADDDLELVRSIQQRFYLPSVSINGLKSRRTGTSLESDDEDDFETLRAIQKRFVRYDADAVKKISEKPLQIVGITAGEIAFNTLIGKKNNEVMSVSLLVSLKSTHLKMALPFHSETPASQLLHNFSLLPSRRIGHVRNL